MVSGPLRCSYSRWRHPENVWMKTEEKVNEWNERPERFHVVWEFLHLPVTCSVPTAPPDWYVTKSYRERGKCGNYFDIGRRFLCLDRGLPRRKFRCNEMRATERIVYVQSCWVVSRDVTPTSWVVHVMLFTSLVCVRCLSSSLSVFSRACMRKTVRRSYLRSRR